MTIPFGKNYDDAPWPDGTPVNGEIPGRRIKTIPGSAVKMQPIRWWEDGIVLHAAVNLLAAREGAGKSTVAASWAARETRNGGTVVWIGTEESREHAQAPRLVAAGADMERILFLDIEGPAKVLGPLQLPLDMEELDRTLIAHKVSMIVMDPCKGLVSSDFRGNDDVAVRQYLEPIAELCARLDIVLIGVTHFGKRESTDSGKLILGSVAWSQVARSVISIAADPDSDTRVLTNTKTNYGPSARSLEFRIVEGTVHTANGLSILGAVEWLGKTTKDARDLLGARGDDDVDERTAAENWLEDYLAVNGPAPSKEVKAAAAKEKISERTLKRAKQKLGVIDRSAGFPRTTIWSLPQSGQSLPQSGQSAKTPLLHGPTGPTEVEQRISDGPIADRSTVGPVGPTRRIYGPTASSPSRQIHRQDSRRDNPSRRQLHCVRNARHLWSGRCSLLVQIEHDVATPRVEWDLEQIALRGGDPPSPGISRTSWHWPDDTHGNGFHIDRSANDQ